MWPLITLPELHSASWLVFDSKYRWSAGTDAYIIFLMDGFMEDTLLKDASDLISPFDGRLYKAIHSLA